MKLIELLKHVNVVNTLGDTGVEITGVNIDSRRIEKGHLFVAIPGTQTDGHKYIPKAIELGAAAILCEQMPEEQVEGVTYVVVESTESAVGLVATQFFGDPSRKLKLVGVTGTNGKTTIATLLYYIICSESSVISAVCCPPSATISKTRPSLQTIPPPTPSN